MLRERATSTNNSRKVRSREMKTSFLTYDRQYALKRVQHSSIDYRKRFVRIVRPRPFEGKQTLKRFGASPEHRADGKIEIKRQRTTQSHLRRHAFSDLKIG